MYYCFLRHVNLCVCVINGVVRHCTKAGHTRLETNKKKSRSVERFLSGYRLRWRYYHCFTRKQNWWIPWTLEQTEYEHPIYHGDRGERKISFLDCLVTRENNTLRTTVYRKPTHTDRLRDQTSYVLQSYFTQSDYCPNLDQKSTNCLRLIWQFDWRNQALEYCFYE